jgi:hypothetical protein
MFSELSVTTRIKWLDRRFDFSFPTGLYPEMIERLRGAPARLEDHLAALDPELLTNRVDGRWSMQENAGHLLDLEPLVQQRIDEYLANAEALHAADMSNRKTYESNYNEATSQSILQSFRTERTKTADRLDKLPPEVFAHSALHPRLNVQMRLVDMLFFQAEHDDFHLTRISELRRLLLSPDPG